MVEYAYYDNTKKAIHLYILRHKATAARGRGPVFPLSCLQEEITVRGSGIYPEGGCASYSSVVFGRGI